VIAKPADDGTDDLILSALPFWKMEQSGTGQSAEAAAQALRRIGLDEPSRGVAVTAEPCVLDGQAGLADSPEAVDRLSLHDRRGPSRPGKTLFEVLQLFTPACEQGAERGEGKIVDWRTGLPSGSLPFRLLAGDSPDQAVQLLLGEALAEIDPGVLTEKDTDVGLIRRPGEEDGDDGLFALDPSG
jgi:hypothetical protein